MIYSSNSPDETEKIASDFAKKLNKGDVITLDGDLGAGKTAFTRGVASGLGIRDVVVSPTFTIVNEYRHGETPLMHFDIYRLDNPDDLYDIGWEEYAGGDGICIVEWAVLMPECFYMPHYKVTITKDMSKSEDFRNISIEFVEGSV